MKRGLHNPDDFIPSAFEVVYAGNAYNVSSMVYPFLSSFVVPDQCEIVIGKFRNLAEWDSGKGPWAKAVLLPACRDFFGFLPPMNIVLVGGRGQSKTTMFNAILAFLSGGRRYLTEGAATDDFSHTRSLRRSTFRKVSVFDTTGISWVAPPSTNESSTKAADGLANGAEKDEALRWTNRDLVDLFEGMYALGKTPGQQRYIRTQVHDYEMLSRTASDRKPDVVVIVFSGGDCFQSDGGDLLVPKNLTATVNKIGDGTTPWLFLLTKSNKVTDFPALQSSTTAGTADGRKAQMSIMKKCESLGASENMHFSFHYNESGIITFESQMNMLQFLRRCEHLFLLKHSQKTGMSIFHGCVGVIVTLACLILAVWMRPCNGPSRAQAPSAVRIDLQPAIQRGAAHFPTPRQPRNVLPRRCVPPKTTQIRSEVSEPRHVDDDALERQSTSSTAPHTSDEVDERTDFDDQKDPVLGEKTFQDLARVVQQEPDVEEEEQPSAAQAHAQAEAEAQT